MSMRIVVVGDVLLDRDVTGNSERLSPDAPVPVVDVEHVHASPGGAGLAALLCAGRAGGVPGPAPAVALLAPLAEDAAAEELRAALAGIEIHALGHEGATRTKTRIRSAGQTLVRVDEGGPGTPLDVDAGHLAAVLGTADIVLVSDYGGGVTRDETVRAALAQAAPRVPMVWDPHPRGGGPVPGCTVVTPNLAEARSALAGLHTGSAPAPDRVADDDLAEALRVGWDARSVAVTAGALGAFLATSGTAELVPTVPVDSSDPCGAGDRFAASVAVQLAAGGSVHRSVAAAGTAAAHWVEAGGAAAFRDGRIGAQGPVTARVADRPLAEDPHEAAIHAVAATRARGGTVVATGGCFDVLHPGHLETLRRARALGDVLVVLLNSDDSVRRLKGPGRPVVGEQDRAALLMGLRDVDGVLVFEEDDPRSALDRLRPDVWAKGGDYRPEMLPEAPLVRSWGGRVEVLPYLPGRSTTGIVERITSGNVDAH